MNYPFTKCLNPRRIINPYTCESLVVECGRCPACSMRKSAMNALRVKLECLAHKYTMFITLTYNNASLPRMMVKSCNRYLDDCGEVCDTGEQFSLIDITQRLGTQGTWLGWCENAVFAREVLSGKVNLPKGILPHLSKYDAQLFIKRLRTNLDRYFNERFNEKAPKIRYYLVGEYGPVHFRPHYHVLLWFESDEIYKIIRQILHKSWSFGRIDCQKSLNKCADYVAKYINSNMSLPQVFGEKQVRPFSIHSAHLGEKVFETTREEVYEGEFERVISRRCPSISTDTDIFLWRSLKAYYFPKCKGYSEKSEYERLFAYSTYVKTFRWTGKTCVAEQARHITYALLYRFYHIDLCDDLYYNDDALLDYFEKSSLFDPYSFEKKSFKDHIEDVFRRIYMELRTSKHFHRFVCKGFINLYKPMMQKIDTFWKDNELFNLKNQCQDISDYCMSDWFEDEEEIQFFFHNRGLNLEKFTQSKAFRCFKEVTAKNFENAVKHKRLNDLNKVFENK